VPPVRPLAEFFCTLGEHVVAMSNGVFNFNFLAYLLSELRSALSTIGLH